MPTTMTSIGNDFRSSQYYQCSSLKGAIGASIIQPTKAGVSYGFSFRDSQYASTPARNVIGLRVKYINGEEVIEG